MKKFLAFILAALMLMTVFAACKPATEDPTPDPAESQDPADPTEKPDDPADPTDPPVESRPNQIIYGGTTEISGDFGRAMWTNGATDNMIQTLIDDYNTVTTDQFGNYVVNPTITENIEGVANEDGTKTFTITIKDGLTYNNGDPITALDFVVATLFAASPVAGDLGVTSAGYLMVVGGEEFRAGEATALSGLRLIDENTFSMTVTTDYVPYYYDLGYASFSPMHPGFWFGEGWTVADDGEGCYFTHPDGLEYTADNVGDQVQTARYCADSTRVSAGPYNIVEFNKTALTATLEINPNYAGNFEGVKPSIEKIIIVKAEEETWFDMIKTGGFDVYDSISSGTEVNTALDYIEEGGEFDTVQFDRAGYGKIIFVCDFGPTQFVAVRQAIAHLIDREEFADTICSGWGNVVHGPYGLGHQMYLDSEELFAEELNTYEYSYDSAVALLEADGWILDETGNAYESGIRYKEVTAEEAGSYKHNVTLDDGRILMPLIIERASSEGGSVYDHIGVSICGSPDVEAAGIQVNTTYMTFSELFNHMYRKNVYGGEGDYETPTYNMLNLATSWNAAVYDQSYEWTQDPELIANGYNYIRLMDDQLDQLSMDMVYGVESGDYESYLDLWQQYIIRWNELLPELPLYSNVYVTMFPSWLEGYEQGTFWGFEEAILYCSIIGAE